LLVVRQCLSDKESAHFVSTVGDQTSDDVEAKRAMLLRRPYVRSNFRRPSGRYPPPNALQHEEEMLRH
jgi:hypothetical protein